MGNDELIKRRTSLTDHVIQFCRFLRSKDFVVGPVEETDTLKALSVVLPDSPLTFKSVLASTLIKSSSQWKNFDDLYLQYWGELEKAQDSKRKNMEEASTNTPKPKENPNLYNIKDWNSNLASNEEAEMASYSAVGEPGKKDFSHLTEHELEALKKMIRQLAKQMSREYSRRKQTSPNGKEFDLRKTMRKNMRRGGEIMDISFRKKRLKKTKLVILCDVSKSMELYSQVLVQFIYAFQQVYKRIESFVFSTELHRITEELEEKSFSKCLEKIGSRITSWSGGTQIGHCILRFQEEYGERLLDKQTTVIIISDGWDTGEMNKLGESMQFIHQKSRKIAWLNPLAGRPGFEPEVKAMAIAMPFIDYLAPAHNLESLGKAIRWVIRK